MADKRPEAAASEGRSRAGRSDLKAAFSDNCSARPKVPINVGSFSLPVAGLSSPVSPGSSPVPGHGHLEPTPSEASGLTRMVPCVL